MHDNMNFAKALKLMQKGYKVARHKWKDRDKFIQYCKGVPGDPLRDFSQIEKMSFYFGQLIPTYPYIMVRYNDGTMNYWNPTQTDVLSHDWYIVKM